MHGAQDERRLARLSLLAKTGGCVRQSRVVLAPVAGVKLLVADAIQPDRFSLKPAATVTRRIRRRGERDISRKAIAQGMPDASAEPVCSCAHFFVHFAHETAGAARTRRSLLPLFEGEMLMQTSGDQRRENAKLCSMQILYVVPALSRDAYATAYRGRRWRQTPSATIS